jgi:hypothetical protein
MTTSGMMPDQSRTPDLVELYQRGADAFNAGDLDTFMGFYAPTQSLRWWGFSGPGRVVRPYAPSSRTG